MNHPWVLLFLAVCALWTFGETVSCDQCGRECADICGTRQFRACCFNNMRKRHSEFFGLKFWMRPRRYAIHLYPAYDV
ncbi:Trissin [Formica fusca]